MTWHESGDGYGGFDVVMHPELPDMASMWQTGVLQGTSSIGIASRGILHYTGALVGDSMLGLEASAHSTNRASATAVENFFSRGRLTVPVRVADLGSTFAIVSEGVAGRPGGAGVQMEVAAASGSDKVDGSGARTVRIVYLNDAFDLLSEVISPKTISPDDTVATTISRVIGFEVATTGSGNENAGDLTLQGTGGGTSYAVILAGRNTWEPGSYTVPNGSQARVMGAQFRSGNLASQDAEILIQAEMDKYTGLKTPGQFSTIGAVQYRRGGRWWPSRGATVLIPEKTEIRVVGRKNTGNIQVSGVLDIHVGPNA